MWNNNTMKQLCLWEMIIGGICATVALVIGLGMRGLDNPNGWPEWLALPAFAILALAVGLICAAWEEDQL